VESDVTFQIMYIRWQWGRHLVICS